MSNCVSNFQHYIVLLNCHSRPLSLRLQPSTSLILILISRIVIASFNYFLLFRSFVEELWIVWWSEVVTWYAIIPPITESSIPDQSLNNIDSLEIVVNSLIIFCAFFCLDNSISDKFNHFSFSSDEIIKHFVELCAGVGVGGRRIRMSGIMDEWKEWSIHLFIYVIKYALKCEAWRRALNWYHRHKYSLIWAWVYNKRWMKVYGSFGIWEWGESVKEEGFLRAFSFAVLLL